ncbi:MAG: hypothetical protein QOC76_5028 [Mycobacterium sp.]|nr:hypothetical protein [Mycobacterium sp.]
MAVKLAAEIRLCEKHVVDLLARVNPEPGQAKSDRHVRAARSRWDRDPVHIRRRGRPDGPRRPPTTGQHAGVYTMLLAREEQESRHSMPHHSNAARLAALRTGQPVDVCAGDLPAGVRPAGKAYSHWWLRATVTADGAVSFYDDDGSIWLAENGI